MKENKQTFNEIRKQQDEEANLFALAILIPKEMLLNELKQNDLDLTDDTSFTLLCKKFQVTHIMMAKRLQMLKLM